MIITSVTGPSMADALQQIGRSRRYADILELRLDMISGVEIRPLLAACRKPAMVTCRPRWEGGAFRGSETERIELLRSACLDGATYVDIEYRAGRTAVQLFIHLLGRNHVVVSRHLMGDARFEPGKVYAQLKGSGAGILKFAFQARDLSDVRHAVKFLRLAHAGRRAAIAIAMGDKGEVSRVLFRKFGGWATYAAPEVGRSAAAGQISARMLKEIYRSHVLTPRSKVFGVIGDPVGQSKGIFVHNRMFRHHSYGAVYCRFWVTSLSKFMRHIAPLLDGFSVTLPHKEAIIPWLSIVDKKARAIGAVNTVFRRGTALRGTNTDAPGALDAIETKLRVQGKRLLILGAGGASRAIAYEALHRGADVIVCNRTSSRAAGLVGDLQRIFPRSRIGRVEWRNMRSTSFDILVNATPVGMVPHVGRSPAQRDILRGKVVFDAVYNPPRTNLLRDAQDVGATTVTGTEMYLNQAARQFALYTGIKPNLGLMRRTLRRHRE